MIDTSGDLSRFSLLVKRDNTVLTQKLKSDPERYASVNMNSKTEIGFGMRNERVTEEDRSFSPRLSCRFVSFKHTASIP